MFRLVAGVVLTLVRSPAPRSVEARGTVGITAHAWHILLALCGSARDVRVTSPSDYQGGTHGGRQPPRLIVYREMGIVDTGDILNLIKTQPHPKTAPQSLRCIETNTK